MAQKNYDETYKKAHQWAFILYPESAPLDWLSILRDSYLNIAVSPLHDRDVKEDGTPDKPHRHVMVMYGDSSTSTATEELAMKVNGSHVIPIQNSWNYFNYFDHHRETNKQLYDHKDIILLNGVAEYDIKTMSKNEDLHMKMEIMQYIRDNHICEYSDLLEQVTGYNMEWFDYAANHTILFNAYLTSVRHKRANEEKKNFIDNANSL